MLRQPGTVPAPVVEQPAARAPHRHAGRGRASPCAQRAVARRCVDRSRWCAALSGGRPPPWRDAQPPALSVVVAASCRHGSHRPHPAPRRGVLPRRAAPYAAPCGLRWGRSIRARTRRRGRLPGGRVLAALALRCGWPRCPTITGPVIAPVLAALALRCAPSR